METQETELLSEAGLVLADPFARKLVQANTKALYRQSKFNLLREDSVDRAVAAFPEQDVDAPVILPAIAFVTVKSANQP